MPSNFQTRAARAAVLPGYPIDEKFKTPEQLAAYFGGARIVCLRCGKTYRSLGIHLKTIHGMEPDEYRDAYDIPWSYGLICATTREIYAADGRAKQEDGTFSWTAANQLAASKQPKRRQVLARAVWNKRAIARATAALIVAGKRVEFAEPREPSAKKGTAEYHQKMSARPQLHTPEMLHRLRTYWKGRKQTPEHIAKRFAKRP